MVHTCWRRKFPAMLVLACVFALPAAGEPLLPKALLSVDPPLSVDDDEATNVSGAACFIEQGVRKSCLLIGDEVRYARNRRQQDRAGRKAVSAAGARREQQEVQGNRCGRYR